MSLIQRMSLIVLTFIGTMFAWNWLHMTTRANVAVVALVVFLVFGGTFFYQSMKVVIEGW